MNSATAAIATTSNSPSPLAMPRQVNGKSAPYFRMWAYQPTISIISSAITAPGMKPPANSLPIEAFACTP